MEATLSAVHAGTLVWLAACACSDLRRGEVSNVLTVPALLAGFILVVAGGWERLLILIAVLAVGFGAQAAGWIGGADAKILVALAGLWPEALPCSLLGVCAWGIARRAEGRQGRLRAVAPMLGGVMGWLLVGWLHRAAWMG